MRKRFHIERQVERLANSRTLDVIEGVLQKLKNPSVKFRIASNYHDMPAHWQCDCTYCRILIMYTHTKLDFSRYERRGMRRNADEAWYLAQELREIRRKMEDLHMGDMLRQHLKDAKIFIGKNISQMGARSSELLAIKRDVMSRARFLIAAHSNMIGVTRHGSLLYGPQPDPKREVSWF